MTPTRGQWMFRGQKYLRVKHAGGEPDSIYLSDLDDEENKEENKGKPVYVPLDGHIDLPLDNDVIQSYEQGTIRGFIDDGLIEAAVYDGSVELLDLGTEVAKGSNGSTYDGQLTEGRIVAPDPQRR